MRVAESLGTLGMNALFRGDTGKAKAFLEESLAAGWGLENRKDTPRILSGLASIASEEGDFERSRRLYEEALALYRTRGEVMGVAWVLNQLAYTELAQSNLEQATMLSEEALAISELGRELDDEETIATGLLILGLAANLQGDPGRAKGLLKDSLAISLKLERKGITIVDLAEILEGLAAVAGALGQHLRATRLWGAAEAMRMVRRPWSSTERMLHEPQLAAARSRLDEPTWEAAFSEGKAMTLEEAVRYALSDDGETDAPKPDASESSSANEPPVLLTRREEEIAGLMARGLTNRQIACDLSISEHTAATHVAKILKKLGLRSRAQIGSWLTEQRTSPFGPD